MTDRSKLVAPGAFALLLAIALGAGCSSATSSAPDSDAGTDAAKADAPPPDAGAFNDAADATPSGKPPAPTQLRALETDVEGISDAAKVSDFVKAQGVLEQAKSNWAIIKPGVVALDAKPALVKMIDDTLAKLQTDITGLLKRETETDANDATLAVPDLFDLYVFAVPSDALRGDGVFRQLQIDSEYSDFTRAPQDLAATKAVWARLKPLTVQQVPKRTDIPGSATVVADMDLAIQRCEAAVTAGDAAALAVQAQLGLDHIDTIETIFK